MSYNESALAEYRALLRRGGPFRCASCPYCNGSRDAAVKHRDPARKPSCAWDFWRRTICRSGPGAGPPGPPGPAGPVGHAAGSAAGSAACPADCAAGSADCPADCAAGSADCPADCAAGPAGDAGPAGPPPGPAGPPAGPAGPAGASGPAGPPAGPAGSAGAAGGSALARVLGPMVDQSELPFRMLCRRYGTTLAYSPMLHAGSFAKSAAYRKRHFSTTRRPGRTVESDNDVNNNDNDNNKKNSNNSNDDDGNGNGSHNAGGDEKGEEEELDFPLIVQFCANDPDVLLAAAREVEDQCEAVDLNLGCPQDIARRGRYGSFLMEDWDRVHCMLHCLAVELRVPVTAKMRVFDDEELTVKYAEMLRDTGISLLCVHGRTRAMKGQHTGAADLQKIRRVREAVGATIPVIANGNVYTADDVTANLLETGADGYMCAEPLLWDPRLFAAPQKPLRSGRTFAETRDTRLCGVANAEEYIALLRQFPVDLAFAKAHLFKLLHHSYELHGEQRRWLIDFDSNRSGGIEALEAHVKNVREAEIACSDDGPQIKVAQKEKRAEKEAVKSLLDGDEDLCIAFE